MNKKKTRTRHSILQLHYIYILYYMLPVLLLYKYSLPLYLVCMRPIKSYLWYGYKRFFAQHAFYYTATSTCIAERSLCGAILTTHNPPLIVAFCNDDRIVIANYTLHMYIWCCAPYTIFCTFIYVYPHTYNIMCQFLGVPIHTLKAMWFFISDGICLTSCRFY